MNYGRSYRASWSESHSGNGKQMRYDFYTKKE